MPEKTTGTGSPRPVPDRCQFARSADDSLLLRTPDGREHRRVMVIRAFPVSAPDGPVAVIDATGRELLWAESLQAFAPGDRHLLAADLAAGEFLPRVEAILSASRREPISWQVLTDRGPHRFVLAAHDAVVRHPDGTATVTDTAGICYLIPAVRQLDRRSRRLLDRCR